MIPVKKKGEDLSFLDMSEIATISLVKTFILLMAFCISVTLVFSPFSYNRGTPSGKAHKRKTHRIYQCKICQVICESQLDFRKHFNSLHADIAVQFAESKTKPDGKAKSDEHESCAENGDAKKQDGESQKDGDKSSQTDLITQHATAMYHCNPCNMVFKEEDIYKHRTKHDRLYTVCDTCGIVFTSCKSWKAHMSKHDAEKSGNRFICKICGHASIFLKDLKKHMGVHSKERPHVCEVCGKTFKQRNALYRHRFVHGDVKPYTCEYCGKGFINRYNLKGHVRTHTGEKPYQCDICNASFTHNVSLKTHKKSAHGIDSWADKPASNKVFDDINVEDPNLYTQGKVDTTSPPKKDNTPVTIKFSQQSQPRQPQSQQQPQEERAACNTEPRARVETDNQQAKITKENEITEKMPPLDQNPKQILTNPPPMTNPPPNVPSHHNMPPLPVPQGFMQFNEVRQFIPLMMNPFEYAGSSDMDHSATETAGKSFTNL